MHTCTVRLCVAGICQQDHQDVVEYLLDAYFKLRTMKAGPAKSKPKLLDETAKGGKTTILLAKEYGHKDIFKQLKGVVRCLGLFKCRKAFLQFV